MPGSTCGSTAAAWTPSVSCHLHHRLALSLNRLSGLWLQVPWYVCAGNHDYYGGTAGIDAEISYSDKSDRWVYPELYFNKEVTGSDGTTFNIISIDTWRINGGDTYVLFDLKTGKSVLRNVSKVKADFEAGLMDKGQSAQDFALSSSPPPSLCTLGYLG